MQQTSERDGAKPLFQKIFDNAWFLLAIGIGFPGVFYFAWGVLELFVFGNSPLADYLKINAITGGAGVK